MIAYIPLGIILFAGFATDSMASPESANHYLYCTDGNVESYAIDDNPDYTVKIIADPAFDKQNSINTKLHIVKSVAGIVTISAIIFLLLLGIKAGLTERSKRIEEKEAALRKVKPYMQMPVAQHLRKIAADQSDRENKRKNHTKSSEKDGSCQDVETKSTLSESMVGLTSLATSYANYVTNPDEECDNDLEVETQLAHLEATRRLNQLKNKRAHCKPETKNPRYVQCFHEAATQDFPGLMKPLEQDLDLCVEHIRQALMPTATQIAPKSLPVDNQVSITELSKILDKDLSLPHNMDFAIKLPQFISPSKPQEGDVLQFLKNRIEEVRADQLGNRVYQQIVVAAELLLNSEIFKKSWQHMIPAMNLGSISYQIQNESQRRTALDCLLAINQVKYEIVNLYKFTGTDELADDKSHLSYEFRNYTRSMLANLAILHMKLLTTFGATYRKMDFQIAAQFKMNFDPYSTVAGHSETSYYQLLVRKNQILQNVPLGAAPEKRRIAAKDVAEATFKLALSQDLLNDAQLYCQKLVKEFFAEQGINPKKPAPAQNGEVVLGDLPTLFNDETGKTHDELMRDQFQHAAKQLAAIRLN